MLFKLSKKSSVKNILVVSLSNIGDVVMTAPVVDVLRRDFPYARIVVSVGPKAISLFEGNPNLEAIVYDKRGSWQDQVKWFFKLCTYRFDVVVDLRNTALPWLLLPRFTSFTSMRDFEGHMTEKHLTKLHIVYEFSLEDSPCKAIVPVEQDKCFFDEHVASFTKNLPFLVIAPAAADSSKRWGIERFADFADHYAHKYPIVLVGGESDVELIAQIQKEMRSQSLSLAGKINLRQLAFVLSKAKAAITNDSGPMHLASYLDVPVLALFGPTDPWVYGPWSITSKVIRKNNDCPRCEDLKLEDVRHTCMASITIADVIEKMDELLDGQKP